MPLRRPPSAFARTALALVLVATAAGCGGDATGTGTSDSVDSVVITGAPSSLMLAGDSVRLVATAVNSTGGTVANQRIAWSSSAPTVAAVRSNGTLLAVGAGEATITAAASGHDATITVDVAYGTTVDQQGAVITGLDGAFKITIPANGIAQPTLVTVRPVTNPPADDRLVPGTAYEVGPSNVGFFGSTIVVKYDPSKIPSGLPAGSLQLYQQSGTGWVLVYGSMVDTVAKTVTSPLFRTGVYAVRSTPVDRIVISGAAANGAMYVSQTARLGATLYASTGDTLAGRPIQWSSSDASRATVDATGKVTGVAPGAATITASSDGKSATATVTVLVRPTADWTAASDWPTYQHDPQHTGYVDVAVDPTVFRERWVTSPMSSTWFQPTIANGQVYLATNSYFGDNQLVSLTLSGGAVTWQHDFGGIYGTNQPTYDDGTLWITTGGHEDTYIYALSEIDGTTRFRTAFSSQWEHWKAPVIVGSHVVTAGGYYGGMYGFDRSTGTQSFFMQGPQVDGWAPAVSNGLVYATDYVGGGYYGGGGVRAVNPADGTVTSDVSDSRLSAITTPVIGSANDLFSVAGGQLVKFDLGSNQVAWSQSGSYLGMPVVGGGVVYAYANGSVTARRESDGSQLWTWTAPSGYSPHGMALTRNVLFVTAANASAGETFAIDLASHLTVWRYPLGDDLAIGSQGILVVTGGTKVAAITVR